jgi:hypothetical protein
VGKAATSVTIKFTVVLRDPVGRQVGSAAPEGGEGAQQ